MMLGLGSHPSLDLFVEIFWFKMVSRNVLVPFDRKCFFCPWALGKGP